MIAHNLLSFLEAVNAFAPGPVTLGLNRALNRLNNSIEAAKDAVVKIDKHLYTIELGNEPGGRSEWFLGVRP